MKVMGASWQKSNFYKELNDGLLGQPVTEPISNYAYDLPYAFVRDKANPLKEIM